MEEIIIYKSAPKELLYIILTCLLGVGLAYPLEEFSIMMFLLGCLVFAYGVYTLFKFIRRRMKGPIPALTITDQRVIVDHDFKMDVFFTDVEEFILREYQGKDVIEIKYKESVRKQLESEGVIRKKTKEREFDSDGDEIEQLEDFIYVEDLTMKKEEIFALLQKRLEESRK